MFKKLTERFPAASAKGNAVIESLTHPTAAAAPSPASTDAETASPSPNDSVKLTEEEEKEDDKRSSDAIAEKEDSMTDEETPTGGRRSSLEDRTASMKAALAERINSETVSAAASVAASSMFGFMKKAQAVASVAAREGAAKATVWKSKALDLADMDALQKRLSYALDRSAGEVNIDLLNFSYITENVVAMGFPSMNSGANRTFIKDNPIDLVANYLNEQHRGHYMIWNLSEEQYDYAFFENQVLEFNFPGHPAPPLGLMFKICSSMENWLEADEKNLAAVHCLTGKGRTGTVIACYLAWIGRFPNAMEALEYVAERRNSSVEKLTIPSQRRYIQYFTHVMDGVKPRSSPLLLRRVIMNTIPVFSRRTALEPVKKETTATEEGTEDVDEGLMGAEPEYHEVVEEGCCPYLQIFKGGKLVFTTTWRDMESGNGVQWASTKDGSISFNLNCMLQGDVLVRCRHLTDSGERMSMFRGAFHTGYIPQGILRLTKAQLDGACGDDRFDQDFFIDLIFADVQTEGKADGDEAAAQSEGIALNEEDRQAYEDMLHRDEAFWEDIEARKVRLQKQREEQLKKKKEREAARAAEEAAAAAAAEAAAKALAEQQAKQAALAKTSSFSIAEEEKEATPQQKRVTSRRGSWDEEKDKELMSELESLTGEDTSAKSTPAAAKEDDPLVGLAKEFEDMKKLEKELGLDAFSSDLDGLPDGKLDNLSPTNLDLLDAELEGLGKTGASSKSSKEVDDVMNFGADDFDELEEYLSGLSSSK
ncbi:hypothetical protein Poli38472_003251 [Pythium oligandrum]|uniref:Phosphatidylinositol-3,4,5-trisphosphate 3-phosphatase n=1 Tax=Pythium oligandrum TaxID=41045 RepID=A0A8K1C6I3_PYTOL|nr:hypothetical protein Poli38472_003251 [Pythium oligandrum]|eukprot:TMW57326.1 hypothetical protein Poli38472_003251 [Pythium oligandrum]